MRRSPTVRACCALLVAGALTLTACGGEVAPRSDETPTAEPTPSATDEPAPEESSDGAGESPDDPDEEGEGSAALDICSLVTAEEVGSALGAPVTMAQIPGGGCSFAQGADPRAPSASLNSMPLSEQAGGFEAAKTGALSVVDGQAQDLPDTGDQAFFVVGPALGSDSVQGAAVIQLDETLVQVTIVQQQNLPPPDVGQFTIDVATLVASKG